MAYTNFPTKAKIYFWLTTLFGIASGAYHVIASPWRKDQILHLALFAAMSLFAQMRHIQLQGLFSTKWALTIATSFIFAAFFIFPPGHVTLLLLLINIGDWIFNPRKWYSKLFNVSQYFLALTVSTMVWSWLRPEKGLMDLSIASMAAATLAIAMFIVTNALLVNWLVYLNHGQSLFKAGILTTVFVLNEVVSLSAGIGMALLWLIHPPFILFIVAPMGILFLALGKIQRREIEIEGEREELVSLQKLGLKIGTELDLNKLFVSITDIVAESLHAKEVFLGLIEGNPPNLRFVAWHSGDRNLKAPTQCQIRGLKVLIETKEPMIVEDFHAQRHRFPEIDFLKATSVLISPLSVSAHGEQLSGQKDSVSGLLLITNDGGRRDFDNHDLRLLQNLNNYISMAIRNAQLFTTLKTTQEQLLHSEKLSSLGQLISGVAHELNNPLTVIIGYADILCKNMNLDHQVREKLLKILREAERTKRIVENLLSFARKRRTVWEQIYINDILDNALELREYDMKVNNVIVERYLQPDLPPTLGDPHRLQQAFLNIINNAYDAMQEAHRGGKLTVRSYMLNDDILVEFIDDGPGMKEPQKVFDPFYTTKEVGKGTGLGLSICYGIVKDHGGEILAENVWPHGAKFTVKVPIRSRSEVPSDVKRVASGEGAVNSNGEVGKASILIVDDEAELLELQKELLAENNYDVQTANNGEQAIRMLRERDFDLIISDMKMPGFSGPDLYRWVRDNRPGKEENILFITGDTVGLETSTFLEKSQVRYLGKPFDVQEYLAKIKAILSRQADQPKP